MRGLLKLMHALYIQIRLKKKFVLYIETKMVLGRINLLEIIDESH